MNANSPSLSMVADKIWFQGNATINVTTNNSRNLSVAKPQVGVGVTLAE